MNDPYRKSAIWGVVNLIGAILFVALATTRVQADGHGVLVQRITGALDYHISTCSVALANPDGFYDHVAASQPDGSFALSASPDGRVNRVAMVSGDGAYTTHLSQYLYHDVPRINCATYFSDYDGLSPIDALGTAYLQVLTERLGSDAIVGGLVQNFYAQAGTALLLDAGGAHEFLLHGLLDGLPVLTISAVQVGHVSFVTELTDVP